MSTRSRRRRPPDARVQTLIGATGALVAGACSRWLLADATFPALVVIAVVAFVVLRTAPNASLSIIATCTMIPAVAARLLDLTAENLALGMIAGLLATLLVAGPLAIAAMFRQRRAFRRRGWELAALEARTRSSAVQAALQRERMSLTAEMHDGLGHRLTIITVRLGRLSLSPTLAPADRDAVAELRQASAAGRRAAAFQRLRPRRAAPSRSRAGRVTRRRPLTERVHGDAHPAQGRPADDAGVGDRRPGPCPRRRGRGSGQPGGGDTDRHRGARRDSGRGGGRRPGYPALTSTLSVMSPADFAQIKSGDSREAVEPALPSFELLDAPRDRFPPRSGEECRYYESGISFFERRDVHVVCLDRAHVTRTGTVPAP
ncbi:hypothetical protein ACFVH6_37400 [Spirillospora sp. NPDC127200]